MLELDYIRDLYGASKEGHGMNGTILLNCEVTRAHKRIGLLDSNFNIMVCYVCKN